MTFPRKENWTVKIEYDASCNPLYIGYATRGSPTSELVWQIRKVTVDANGNVTDIQWPEKSDRFEFEWDERASYTFS